MSIILQNMLLSVDLILFQIPFILERSLQCKKSREKNLSLSRKWVSSSQNEHLFSSNRRIICRFEKKNAHCEKKILIFEKMTDFFLTIFPSVQICNAEKTSCSKGRIETVVHYSYKNKCSGILQYLRWNPMRICKVDHYIVFTYMVINVYICCGGLWISQQWIYLRMVLKRGSSHEVKGGVYLFIATPTVINLEETLSPSINVQNTCT